MIYEYIRQIKDDKVRGLIECAFIGTQNDVRLSDERIVLSAIQYYENELAKYKQALKDSIKREAIAYKVIESKRKE